MNRAKKTQTTEFHKIKEEIKSLSNSVTHQRSILQTRNIPTKYLPKQKLYIAGQNKDKLNLEFESSYTSIFFTHLQKIVRENEILLAIKECKLASLTTDDSMVHLQKTKQKTNEVNEHHAHENNSKAYRYPQETNRKRKKEEQGGPSKKKSFLSKSRIPPKPPS